MSTCIIPSRPHGAEAGLLICRRHFDQLAEELILVEQEAQTLFAPDRPDEYGLMPSMAIVWDRKGGSLAREQVPVRLDPLVHADRRLVRDDDVDHPAGFDLGGALPVYGVLHDYAARTRTERPLSQPTHIEIGRIPGAGAGPMCNDCQHSSCLRMRWRIVVTDPLSIATERRLLTRQLEWIAAQLWVADLFADVHRLAEQLQRATGTAEPGPIPGRCPRLDENGEECGGHLWPVTPKHTSGAFVHAGDEVVQAIECDRNHNHRWEDKALIRLALILDQQEQAS